MTSPSQRFHSLSPADPACTVAVFARAPVPGAAKTRLIPRLGAEGACDLHRWMVDRTLAMATAAAVGPVEMWCAPDTTHPYFQECARLYGLHLFAQGGGDIGERMLAAVHAVLARSGALLLIGTDCPAMTADDLRTAAAALDQGHDAVFLPVEDGGYTLVGLRVAHAAVFRDVPWSTAEVMDATRARLRQERLRWFELPQRWDLDRPEDLDRLQHA